MARDINKAIVDLIDQMMIESWLLEEANQRNIDFTLGQISGMVMLAKEVEEEEEA